MCVKVANYDASEYNTSHLTTAYSGLRTFFERLNNGKENPNENDLTKDYGYNNCYSHGFATVPGYRQENC